MASSPEQEIPQEIVERAYSAWYASEQKEGATVWNSMCVALAAVLPDLQRPLLEEIERERETRKALAQIADQRRTERKTERDDYLKELGEINVERQRQEVRAVEAERERDARPDLTAEETSVLLESTRYAVPSGVSNEIVASARAKLERSLDAAG